MIKILLFGIDMSKSDLESLFAFHLDLVGLPPPTPEFKFAAEAMGRQWRSDFAWPDKMILVEIEGGIWVKGRHTRGQGFENDCHKYNAAAELGYRVFRFTPAMLHSGEAIALLERVLRK